MTTVANLIFIPSVVVIIFLAFLTAVIAVKTSSKRVINEKKCL